MSDESTERCAACMNQVVTDDSDRCIYTEVGVMHRGCYDEMLSNGDAPSSDEDDAPVVLCRECGKPVESGERMHAQCYTEVKL